MHVCNACGSTRFHVLSGLYFCTECSTQSQDTHVECLDEETQFGEFQGSLVISTKSTNKKKRKVPVVENVYTSYEAYNSIIFHQAKALVKLGASPKMMHVVLQLYAMYLRKSQVAFRDDWAETDDWGPCLCAFPRKRDVQILSGETTVCYRKDTMKKKLRKGKKKLMKEKRENAAVVHTERENSASSANHEAMQLDPVQDIIQEIQKTEDNEKKLLHEYSDTPQIVYKRKRGSALKQSLVSKSLQKKKGKKTLKKIGFLTKESHSEYLSLPRTVCFSYLGLLLNKEEILLCDIIRLIKEGHFPYMDATHHLPPNMLLQESDWNIFTPAMFPSMKKIVDLSTELAKFIGLSELPHRPLLPIAIRFIKDLKLPDDLFIVVKNLLNEVSSASSKSSNAKKTLIPMYEVKAMAYVLVATKLLFGLDDEAERKLSQFAHGKNKRSNESKFFVWDEWFSNTKLNLWFLQSRNVPYLFFHEHVLDIDLMHSNYFDFLRTWNPKTSVVKHTSRFSQPDVRDDMSKIFCEMRSKTNNCSLRVDSASSFPLQTKLIEQTKLLGHCYQYSSSKPDCGSFLQNLSSHSLSLIFNHWNSNKCHKNPFKFSGDDIRNHVKSYKKQKRDKDSHTETPERKKHDKKSKSLQNEEKGQKDNVKNLVMECGSIPADFSCMNVDNLNSMDKPKNSSPFLRMNKEDKTSSHELHANNSESENLSEKQNHKDSCAKQFKSRRKNKNSEVQKRSKSKNRVEERSDHKTWCLNELESDMKDDVKKTQDRNCTLKVFKTSRRSKNFKKRKHSAKLKSHTKKTKKKKHSKPKSCSRKMSERVSPRDKDKTPVFSKSYFCVNLPASRIKDASKYLPETFKWFLELTSKMIESSSDVLYREVLTIERQLFKEELKKEIKCKQNRTDSLKPF